MKKKMLSQETDWNCFCSHCRPGGERLGTLQLCGKSRYLLLCTCKAITILTSIPSIGYNIESYMCSVKKMISFWNRIISFSRLNLLSFFFSSILTFFFVSIFVSFLLLISSVSKTSFIIISLILLLYICLKLHSSNCKEKAIFNKLSKNVLWETCLLGSSNQLILDNILKEIHCFCFFGCPNPKLKLSGQDL